MPLDCPSDGMREVKLQSIKHQRPDAIKEMSLDQIMERYTASFRDRDPDWKAFADSDIEGFKRAQHRFIGAGGSGKQDPKAIPAGGFTLSVMFIPPGQGGNAHTHEIEEVFFVLEGVMTVFIQDDQGNKVSKRLGKWDCISCPAGVLHGFVNESVEPAYMMAMIGSGRPGPVGFVDDKIYAIEQEKLAKQAVPA